MYHDPARRFLAVLICILSLILLVAVGFAAYLYIHDAPAPEYTLPATTAPTTQATTAPTETTVPTTAETTVETTVATEPQPEYFTLSFAGDCTFGNRKERFDADTFISIVGEDYSWPFADVMDYFANDDATFINLEGPLTDGGSAADKTFVFKGPTDYVNIMTQGSVEFANVANNHSFDYGQSGYQDTLDTLDSAGIAYAESGKTTIFTTQSGLKIGVYAQLYPENSSGVTKGVKALREQGAEVVIAALHWGIEYHYNPNGTQVSIGRAAIDAGADIVYGHHPHVLQKIEQYNGGVIYYSLANFSFGGNTNPIDKDSAIIRQEIIRQPDGAVELGQTSAIPVFITGINPGNDFQPTPMEEGSEEYERVMKKLAGEHNVDVLYVPYRDDLNNTTEPTTEPTVAPTEPVVTPTEPTETPTAAPTEPAVTPTEPTAAPTEPLPTAPEADPDPDNSLEIEIGNEADGEE